MRILTVTKRQYMNRDLLDDHFGRFRELPMALARRGHEVRGLCLSYDQRGNGQVADEDQHSEVSVIWDSVDLGASRIGGLVRFAKLGRQIAHSFEPDVIWAGSDGLYGPLGELIAARGMGAFVFDVYDDFDGFASMRIPGARALYHRACRNADGVTSFSDAMTSHIVDDVGRTGPTVTLVNGTDTRLFRPMDKSQCRSILGLPGLGRFIGVAGSLSGRDGLATLLSAFETLAGADPDVHLVVAGPRGGETRIPTHDRIHDLGMVPYEQMPVVLNSLDVGVVLPREGRAGTLGFPYRAYEMLACMVPIVAVDVGAMPGLLADTRDSLFQAQDVDDLVRAVRARLDDGRVPKAPVPDWDEVAESLEQFLGRIIVAS